MDGGEFLEALPREEHLIAQALWLAVRYHDVSLDRFRRDSDSSEMLRLLVERYADQFEHFELTDVFRVAMRRGFEPRRGDGLLEALAFLKNLPEERDLQ